MRSTRTRTRHRWIAAVASMALVAAACGGDDDDVTGGAGTDAPAEGEAATTEGQSFDDQAREQQGGGGDTTTAGSTDTATGTSPETTAGGDASGDTPVRGGNLVISGPSDIGSLDPLTSSSFNTQYRISEVYQRLLTFDTGPDIGYTEQVLKPELATEWEVSDDSLTYTFTLREGVVWQNVPPVNGRPFVAADVKATFEAIMAEGHQANLLSRVTSIETPDDLTVVLKLSAPYAPLLSNMASHFMWILPQEAFQPGYDRASTVIGTGPFMLADREIDVVTRFVRNPDYWDMGADGEPLPYLDSYDQVVINDTQQVIAQFKAGEIDILTNGIPADLRDQLVADTPDAQHNEWIDAGMGQLGVNAARPPFDDLRVRKAVSMAIDREGQGSTIWIGGTIPSNVSPALAEFALPEEERYELLPYDPEGAKALLAEAGYPDGLPATLIATDGYGARYVQATELIVEDLNAAGFDVTLELLDYSTYFGSRWPDGEFDLQFGPQTPFLEPDEWLRTQMQTDAARNWYNISDPQLDAMLDEQLTILDRDERAEKIKEIQRYALENVMNPIPTWTYLTQWSYAPEFRNFYRHASYGFPGIERAWLDS
jgi:peptide/nickel transport system substrate-binding protein